VKVGECERALGIDTDWLQTRRGSRTVPLGEPVADEGL
jgi:hypothetical protein